MPPPRPRARELMARDLRGALGALHHHGARLRRHAGGHRRAAGRRARHHAADHAPASCTRHAGAGQIGAGVAHQPLEPFARAIDGAGRAPRRWLTAGPRALVAGPGAARALRAGGSGTAGGRAARGRLRARSARPDGCSSPGRARRRPAVAARRGPRAPAARGGLRGARRRRGHARRRAAPDRRRWAVGAGLTPAPTESPAPGCRGAMAAALAAGRARAGDSAPGPRGTRAGRARAGGPAPGRSGRRPHARRRRRARRLRGLALAAGEPATLSALAAPRCSPIGLAYLRCAERGEVPEPATALIGAVRRGDARAAGRHADALGSWGSSSGAALVWGMAAALGPPPA